MGLRMTNITLLSTIALAAVCCAAPAHAQLARTFVSAATGNDANDCNRLTPCRTFQRAHDNTFDQGEVTVLDPGGYGAVTIRKSISIVNDGVGESGVLVSGGVNGITVNGGPATYVNLRGLTVQGIGFGGGTGLLFTGGFTLTITNCVFRNLTGDGIDFFPIGTAQLSVSNTLLADNGLDGLRTASPDGNSVKIDLHRVEARNNSIYGAYLVGVPGGLHTSIIDSVFSGSQAAIYVQGDGGRPSTAVVMHSALSNSGSGVQVVGNAFIAIGQSLIAGNASTWNTAEGGTVSSFGDNYVYGNFDGDRPMTIIARK